VLFGLRSRQQAAVEAAPLLEAAEAAAPAPQYELLRVDQMVVVVWRFYIVAHGALSVTVAGEEGQAQLQLVDSWVVSV